MANIETAILLALAKYKEIHGTETLAAMIGTRSNVIATYALKLSQLGMIYIEKNKNGGRGVKTVYRDAGVIRVKR